MFVFVFLQCKLEQKHYRVPTCHQIKFNFRSSRLFCSAFLMKLKFQNEKKIYESHTQALCVSHSLIKSFLFRFDDLTGAINFLDRLDERCEIWKKKWKREMLNVFHYLHFRCCRNAYVTLCGTVAYAVDWKAMVSTWHESHFICDLWSDTQIWTLCQLSGLNFLNAG